MHGRTYYVLPVAAAATLVMVLLIVAVIAVNKTSYLRQVITNVYETRTLQGKKIAIISASVSLRSDIGKARKLGVIVEPYMPDLLLNTKLLEKIIGHVDAIVFDEVALKAIAMKREIVEQLLYSNKPLILIAKRPISLLLKSFTLENVPLTVIPIEDVAESGAAVTNRQRDRDAAETSLRIGLGRDVYAVVIITHPICFSEKLSVTYMVYHNRVELVALLRDVFSPMSRISITALNNTNSHIIKFSTSIVDNMYTWQGLGSFIDRADIASKAFGDKTVGVETIWLHFSYATDFKHITRPELGLWRIEVIHSGELTFNYWVGRPNEISLDVSLFDDQDIVSMWPYSETTGSLSLTISFIPEKPYISPSITLTIDNDIYIDAYRKYEYSSYYNYNYDRVYEAGWRWGEDLPSIFRRDKGSVGAAAYITAKKELSDYGILGGIYVSTEFVGSLVCDNVLQDIIDNPSAYTVYRFYVSPLHVELLSGQ